MDISWLTAGTCFCFRLSIRTEAHEVRYLPGSEADDTPNALSNRCFRDTPPEPNAHNLTDRVPWRQPSNLPQRDSLCRINTSIGRKRIYKATNPIVSAFSPTESAPGRYALLQNYPNPFNPSTTISFELPRAAHVTLKVCTSLGQEVATLIDETRAAGKHEVQFDADNVASGIYFYHLRAGSLFETKKLILLR